jgi:spore coat polysaccharide biosynthesis protein SpsF
MVNEFQSKATAIIQARMGSSRLPGKVLKDVNGKPMLAHVIERAGNAKRISQVVVATTLDPSDDILDSFCREMGVSVFRGSVHDVLDRFYNAAVVFHADPVVRLTADCPLIDPELIDLTLDSFYQKKVDFAANRLPPPFTRTYPIGLDVEVCSFAALERAWMEAILPYEREHVLPYLYDVPGRFNIFKLDYDHDLGSLRWTVDTPEDLEVVRTIFNKLSGIPEFGWLDVVELLKREPEIMWVNAAIRHKSYLDVDHRAHS